MKHYHVAAAVIGLLAAGIQTSFAQEILSGDLGAHDPSTIVEDSGSYYLFTTGSGIPCKVSTDLHDWTDNGIVVSDPPAWAAAAVPDHDPDNWNWAPDVAYFNGKYHVYYSISEWGTIDSAIGLMTSPSLSSPTWTDAGKVVQSDAAGYEAPETDTTAFNCIDPAMLVDDDGSVWMIFGSYSSGIIVTEINPATGLRMNPGSFDVSLLANNTGNRGWGSSIEGAFVYKHSGMYYLFVNYGGCCSGIDSTYNIRVGRSASVTGPYVDKNGVDMRDGGGTMLLESSGRFVGPGHAGIFNDGETEWFSYHYYTWGRWSELGLSRISWDEDDWPTLPNDWSALYTFNTDAREHSTWYDGALQDGAAIVQDDVLGSVLELDGTGYVELHEAIANCSSVAAWVKWDGTNDWERIFDFGNDTAENMFLTPRANSGTMRFAIKNGGGEQQVNAPFALPTNTWSHVAITLDGEQGILYFNGDAVATNAVTIRPWEMLGHTNYVGKSHYESDPGFEGRIASFRVFADALTPEEVQDVAAAHPALAHRYSFAANADDSIGMAHGTLHGDAVVTNEAVSLSGQSGSYVELPSGVVSGCGAVSIEFWADIGANGNWARVFDFGNYNGDFGYNSLFLTPVWNGSQARLDMNGAVLDLSGTLNNRSAHVVCVVDPANDSTAVYIDGELAGERAASTADLSTIDRTRSFLGRSLYAADPYLIGDIDEFRIYDTRLTADEIADHYAAGPDVDYLPASFVWTNDAQSLSFEWPTYPGARALEYTTQLGPNAEWVPLAPPMPANGLYSQMLEVDSLSTSNAFFRLRH